VTPGGRVETAAWSLFFLALAASVVEFRILSSATNPASLTAGDLRAYYHPMLAWGFERLAQGDVPLWNPRQSCGTPFLAIPQIGLFYPLYLPFLFLDAATAVDLDIVLHLALAGLGMFLLCRHYRMTRTAALIAGIVFAYHGSMLFDLYFPNFLAPVAWTPFVVLLVERLFAHPSGRRAALLGVVGATCLLGALVQFLYYTALALVPVLAWRTGAQLGRGVRAVLRPYGYLLAAAGLAVLLALVRVLPAAEYMALSWRPPGGLTPEMVSIMSVAPSVFGHHVLSPRPGFEMLRQVYVGSLPLALAVLGVVLWRRRSIAIPLAVAGGMAVLYAFGRWSFVQPLLYHLPLGSWFRGPNRALFVFGFAVAVLCGAGIDVVGRTVATSRTRRRVFVVLGAVLTALFVAGTRVDPAATRLLAFHYGAGLATLLVLASPRPVLRLAAAAGLAGLVLFDLLHAQRLDAMLPSQLSARASRYEPFFRVIRERQELDRTYIWGTFQGDAPLLFYSGIAKAGMNHGIWQATDYEAVCGMRTFQYQSAFGRAVPNCYVQLEATAENMPLVELLGVRFFMVRDGSEARFVDEGSQLARGWWRVMSRDGVSLYEYDGRMPRAFLVPRVEVVPDAAEVLARLRAIDLRTVAVVEQAVAISAPGDDAPAVSRGEVRIVEYQPERVVLEATTADDAFLVLTDQFYPGWVARVDGVETPIHRTNFLFRGVALGAGRHRVEFVYRPRSFTLGLAGTAAGLLLLAAAVVVDRRARARRTT
jgi:hypothetical protein